ncbi:MAG: YggT family protein [Coriobacteriales bacterium]|jgi:YggT family protein
MIGGPVSQVICSITDLYVTIIVIYVLLSWFPHTSGVIGTIYSALGTICEPYLGLFRKILPPIGGVDFSPILAVIILELVVRLIF